MEGFDESIGGKWKLLRNENFDEYLSLMGIGYIKRKIACAFTTVMVLSKVDDDKVRIVSDGPKHSDTVANLGEEIEECDPFDNKIKVKMNWNPETKVLRTESYPSEGSKAKKAFVERKIDPETKELIMEVSLPDEKGGFICKRIFKKVE